MFMSKSNLEKLSFDNSFISNFPGELTNDSTSRATPEILFCQNAPTAVCKPEILIWSKSTGRLLDLDSPSNPIGLEAEVFAGNKMLTGMLPYSTRYGGHQFGYWAGQLGDGRAISLGEVINSKNQRLEIQLKGAGPTPYSRRADGRAVLRSSLREFLCSEAMFYLNVPTTRALCCTLTGEKVMRDLFYDGHPELEPGAITTRIAPSFLRFGHYEILSASGEFKLLKGLVDYTIEYHYPEFHNLTTDKYLNWFTLVCERTAKLMAEWLRVGFVHGVMNTDNLSILGMTIDYGPYGWLDVYDPDWTPNTTDNEFRRYRFGNQANIAFWNLTKLAEALEPLIESEVELIAGLDIYKQTFEKEILKSMSAKLGFDDLNAEHSTVLITELDSALRATETDPTIFYRQLAKILEKSEDAQLSNEEILALLQPAFYQQELLSEVSKPLVDWTKSYLAIQAKNPLATSKKIELMNNNNPYFILRNYIVQEALEKLAVGDRAELDSIMEALKTPYQENEFTKKFFARRPEWARTKPGCASLSCSS